MLRNHMGASKNTDPSAAISPYPTMGTSRAGDACGAVVLAAGTARRFGSPKLLMPFGESTVLGSVVAALTGAGIAPVFVVGGDGAEAIEASLEGAAQVVRNPDPARGMISSIRVGVAMLPSSLGPFLIALGDQPRITAEGISHLLKAHGGSGKGIALPTHRGKRGHPVVFASSYRQAILALRDNQTLREVIHSHPDDCVEVDCDSDAYVRDIDTPEQYEDEFRRSRAER
jgi:molybdenum cofactor cytidylyltransferase